MISLAILNRTLVLNSLIKHETITITDFAKEGNLGAAFNGDHLQFLIDELTESGHVQLLEGGTSCTYTITVKGIRQGARLAQE